MRKNWQVFVSLTLKLSITKLTCKRDEISDQLSILRNMIGKKVQSGDSDAKLKTHHDFLMKEMLWMSEDFERERKRKWNDAKKLIRQSKKKNQENLALQEKEEKEARIELRKKANSMSKIVSLFWRGVQKIIKHNYDVLYDQEK